MNRAILYVALSAYVAWRMYRRMRRNIGRQPLRPRRIVIRLSLICLFTISIAVLLVSHSPQALAGFGGGFLGGALLGFFGLRLTRFETTEQGHFYIPDTRMGVGISSLLAARVIYRVIVPPDFTLIPGHPPQPFSPLTFFFVGITFGYFVVYLIGLLVHTHDKNNQQNVLPPGNSV